ncbi:MAG: hypothetical protein UV61_C0010G0021 [Candidatus Gottesmanbacteria bacterium GW2011_GWB1_43_11]|uniref:Integral membrane protein n=1 Tax=Candidatus Gottesmanbacteria bacterium GW2011_GWB1_43_11 TaxID=1618446 RepID=A0A0G1CKX2_9BACT|nr:MAG: hypothetical protein UV04_C0012G0021 [Candidatus Gottesmanbacteria bacterium GW2011_GWA2_42_16]KKS53537.1 MAG: hypothetical protein UV17_C0035G0022 [Candidatus Gottesmanbacteria bacterium GW2011_GWA1_42_26]KKS81211.1 MAG: hypothetical protein UV55_C0018G0021 [Candidatus Gottesmanbacteria bacterium GW2011_GWC1_43_10]KKS86470.1 MAG: hypothetical protein UV61_C0010G0021 [Candidatus Gottesmanbacteria bacterium GW2011_GWB1_43_11]OGG10115.1 MAG: hypothetical protein A2699_03690 [Candidatus Go
MFTWIVGTAQAAAIDIGQEYGPAQSFPTLGTLMNVILPNILTLAGIVVLVFVVASGLIFMNHAGKGESDKTAKDKQAFTAAVIGLMIIFGAYFLIQIVETLLGYKFLSPTI